ncbi:MAG: AAA family ATPase [Aminipila sp.]
MSIKINKLEIENVKRVKAVTIEPTTAGLTIVGGKNNQGKTSVLDAIAWGLGGEKYRPSEPRRDGSVVPPALHIELSNGLVVERKGKNSDLKVIDPSGNKAGQQLLNEFVSQFALDLPKFMEASNKDKANTLLQIIGVGEQLFALEKQETELYNRRKAIGQIADQKKKYAAELTDYPDAPADPVSASELIKQQQEILTRNGENQRKRENIKAIQNQLDLVTNKIEELKTQLYDLGKKEEVLINDLEAANKSAIDLHDESTEELERNIENIEEINRKVRANQDKEKAEDEAREYAKQYSDITKQIEDVRKSKTDLLEGAKLPLEGLSVADGELTYKGYKWGNMSGSDQLKVSAAIVRKLNPECGFVLMDKLEQMDMDTLQDFGKWLEQEGLQAIATRVSTGDECSIIIEDGYSSGQGEIPQNEEPKWKAGEF